MVNGSNNQPFAKAVVISWRCPRSQPRCRAVQHLPQDATSWGLSQIREEAEKKQIPWSWILAYVLFVMQYPYTGGSDTKTSRKVLTFTCRPPGICPFWWAIVGSTTDVRGSCNILKVVINHQRLLKVLCDPSCVTSDRVNLPTPGEVPAHSHLEPEHILTHWTPCFVGFSTPGLLASLRPVDIGSATIKSHHWIQGWWLCTFLVLSFLSFFPFHYAFSQVLFFMLLDCCFSNQNGYNYLFLP